MTRAAEAEGAGAEDLATSRQQLAAARSRQGTDRGAGHDQGGDRRAGARAGRSRGGPGEDRTRGRRGRAWRRRRRRATSNSRPPRRSGPPPRRRWTWPCSACRSTRWRRTSPWPRSARSASTLTAPVAGTVVQIVGNEGDPTGAGPILTLAAGTGMVVIAEVYATDVHKLRAAEVPRQDRGRGVRPGAGREGPRCTAGSPGRTPSA